MKIEIFSTPDQIFEKDFDVFPLTVKQRGLRAVKMSGLLLGGALVFAPIPVVHLIMVPLCLFLAVVSGVWKWRQKIEVHGTDLMCPECHAPQKLGSALVEWPYRGHCSQCRTQFIVRPKA